VRAQNREERKTSNKVKLDSVQIGEVCRHHSLLVIYFIFL